MASNRIRGVTIEIDGNATKLEKALKGVNQKLNTSKSDLKDIDKLLKLDPGNVELLKQKQDALNKATEATKSKIEEEKKILEQLKNSDQTPEVARNAEVLERQIIEDEKALESLEKQMKDFGSVGSQQIKAAGKDMQDLGDKISSVGDKMGSVGAGMTAKVTAPIVGLGAAAVAAYNEVDKGADIIVQKTGAAGEAANEMTGIMKNLAKTIPTDFETAGAAVGEVNTRFGLTGEALEDLSGKYIKFADLNKTDVSTSIDDTQKALSAFGLGAESAGGLLDTLNKTAQDTGVDVGTLTSGLVTNATAFQELGLSIDQSTVFMGQLEKSGANSETVLNGMRKALKNATDQGIPLNDALIKLQDSILNGTDGMDGLTAAYDLFGKSGDQIYGAIKNGTLDFAALGQAAADAGGSVSETFEETLDPADRFKQVMNQLQITGADLGATIGEMLIPVLEIVQEVLAVLSEKWNSLDADQQKMIVTVGLVIAAIGPLITIISGVVHGVGTVIGVLGGAITAIGNVAAVLGGPLTIAIAAVIALCVFLVANWETVMEWAGKLKEKISQMWDAIKNKTGEMAGAVKEKWDAIKTAAGTAMEGLKSKVEGDLGRIKGKFDEAGGGIKGAMSAAMEGVKILMENEFSVIDSLTGGKLTAIKNKFTEAFDGAKTIVQNALNTIKGFFNFSWDLPKLKLPHPRISGKFSLNPPQAPSFSIDWYKKAYQNPIMFTSPTVLPTVNGLKGFGDGAGAEVVMSDKMLAKMAGSTNYNITVNAAPGMDVRQLADAVQARLAQVQRQKESVYA